MPAFYTWASGDTITSARLNRIEQMAANEIIVFLVAGGGGGGSTQVASTVGGGGGGGGVFLGNFSPDVGDALSITIGAGGAAAAQGTASQLSGLGTVIVNGGGRGGGTGGAAGTGGSGGGAYGLANGASGTSGQGSHGGRGWELLDGTFKLIGGGGGGASMNGEAALYPLYGVAALITDIPYCWANGGTGVPFIQNMFGGGGANGVPGSLGGIGGGGNAPAAIGSNGNNGAVNSGGGGSGSYANSATLRTGGQGGSGVCYVAYRGLVVKGTGGTTIGGTFGWIVHQFNATGTFTWTG